MFMKRSHGLLAGIASCSLFVPVMAAAQSETVSPTPIEAHANDRDMLTRYERAAIYSNKVKYRFVQNQDIVPTWIGETDRFWYCRETDDGCTYTVVDAKTGKSATLFDQADLSAKLTRMSGNLFPAGDLKLGDVDVAEDGQITFTAFEKRYSYSSRRVLKEIGEAAIVPTVISPDGGQEAFIKGWDIWVRDLKTGKEKAVTTDGQEFYAYGRTPAASRTYQWAAEVRWAPDSKRIFTVQTDDRQVEQVPYIEYAPEEGVRPRAFSQPYAFPGDAHIPTFRMVVIDTATMKQTAIRYQNVPVGRMLDAPPQGGRAWWSGDGQRVFFVDTDRGEKTARLISADAATGEAIEIMKENNPAGYVELSENVYGTASIVPLPARNQVVWYSERSGVPQLYLIDLATGQQLRELTSKDYTVREILSVDEKRGEAIVSISGREPGRNPYYREVLRIALNTGEGKILSQGDEDRFVATDHRYGMAFSLLLANARRGSGVSPTGNYFVETQSRIDRPAVTLIRDRSGKQVSTLETARLNGVPSGFRWPEPVLVRAADGQTMLQGMIVRPPDFDTSKKYPVIDIIYGGPQVAVVPTNLERYTSWALSLAELGFVVVTIDGRGTTGRNRAFHETSYGAAEKASDVEDHIAAIRELAGRYPYMDLDRVGITGFSGGGYMSTSALLRYPDFFKVAVSGAGNHDQRDFWFSWGERYQGLLDGGNYLPQANLSHVGNLKGKLMLYHGLLDTGVQPGTVFNLVQKLEEANKDFDLVIAPRAPHAFTSYGERRMWDYFVTNLAGETPPHEFKLVNDFEYTMAEMKRRKGGAAKPKDDVKARAEAK